MQIKQAINVILEQEGMNKAELANELGITQGMVSHYAHHGHYPRLNVAAKIYGKYRIQVEPYTELALSDELERQHDK